MTTDNNEQKWDRDAILEIIRKCLALARMQRNFNREFEKNCKKGDVE